MPPYKLDLHGKKFERLTVVRFSHTTKIPKGTVKYWECLCDCGNKVTVAVASLTSGNTKSCGCIHKEGLIARNFKHGHSHKRSWLIWFKMHDRCNNPFHIAYRYYGGRGITVCERWALYENFFVDMGEPPSQFHQIDRINNELGYFKENCRWATKSVQMKNRRKPQKEEQNASC